ncbi:poly-gamma-glutamate biosynthesis protein PgsC/CapC [Azoarcus sp. CIB]|uniref:poly-gamma-glutamate biosynthesis protein PgsC/CapC n=1 Tax=Aromatoleum sp. (strain CIB) TaxID=198107 RepID=UPI00067E5A72|nr:poly-gamma-glutamate biosynthesis protein PgsC/CapC [Azoarcus sp. CIB]
MPEWFPLPIFPEGGLAGSVVTTVWIGVAVVVFFNLRLGWVLSGLVVPGYLVPLLLTKPAAAAVVVGEGILTYALVWFYSEFLSRRTGWSNFFGRDRFFALVLCSVLVRIAADGFALPALGEWVNQSFQVQLDYRNNLHSFGLIIVALIANNFWKTGLLRGLLPLVVTTGVTLLIVRYGLMTATNFNISSLSYMYEDIAASILASPKAYIILIATAFLASRMNLLYGWDFAGILVPSLLALQWYQPGKILASFVEATVILLLAHAVLKLPAFRGVTVEGGRKLMLFFNISFAYKFVLAWLVLWLVPEQKITDLYGFGYLLPTLIALKMHDKGIYARMTRATLQTSLVAVFGATLAGFALSFLPDPTGIASADGTPPPAVQAHAGKLVEVVREARIAAYRTRLQVSVPTPNAFELDRLREGLMLLADYRREREPARLAAAMKVLEGIDFRIERIEGRYLLLRDSDPGRFWGLYVIDLDADTELAVEVPAPLDERGSAESGAWLFRSMRAQSLAIAGSTRTANKDGSADVLRAPNTAFQMFHQVFGAREVLQVRGYTAESARIAHGWRSELQRPPEGEPASLLWVKGTLPDGLDLARLRELAGSVALRWGELPLPNLQRDTLYARFAELQLHRDDVRRLLGRALAGERGVAETVSERSIEGYLQDWLLSDPTRIAASGTDLYVKPGVEDLLFFDDEVVTPLQAAAAEHYRDGAWAADGLEELRMIQGAATALGYELLRYRHRGSGSGTDYLILAEADRPADAAAARRYWGTYVFRLGPAEPFVVGAPRPLFEHNSFEMAVALFESLRARALLVGGASPAANRDGSADIVRLANKENLFNVVGQSILRQAGDAPLLTVQSRAMSERTDAPLPGADVLLAAGNGALDVSQLGERGRRLVDVFGRYGLSVAFAGGELASAGYEVGAMPQVFYLNATQGKEFVTFWASPLARAGFRQQTGATAQQAQAMALGLASVEEDIAAYVARHERSARTLPSALRAMLARYSASQDIVVLHGALTAHPQLRFERVVDVGSRQGFLAVLDRDGGLLALANLTAREPERDVALKREALRASLDAFVEGRAGWLLMEDAR